MPGISAQQALLLLSMLYAERNTLAWADACSFQELRELASICHGLDCKQLLAMLEPSLIKQASSNINTKTAVDIHTSMYTHRLSTAGCTACRKAASSQ